MRKNLSLPVIKSVLKANLNPKSLRPTFAGLIITGSCNLRCQTCAYWRKKHDELSTDQWKKIIDELYAAGFREWGLIGGEVLLRKDFYEIAKYAKQRGVQLTITTNGVIVDRYLTELDLFDTIGVSIDAPNPALHDKIRGVPGTFDKAVKNMRLLIARGKKVGINCVIQADNYKEIPRMVKFAEDNKAAFLDLPYVSTIAFDESTPDDESLRKFDVNELRTLLKEACNHRIVTESYGYYETCIERTSKPVSRRCLAPYLSILISTNGDVFPCCGPLPSVGNLTEKPFEEIWRNYRGMREAALKGTRPECQRCTATAIDCHYTWGYLLSKLKRNK